MDLTPGTLMASLLVSSVGFAFFRYGRKELRLPQLVTGVVMMVYPYFVPGALAMSGVAAALLAALWMALRAGY